VAGGIDDLATASIFRALADPTRRQILQDLRDGELAAGDIASHFPISGPSVSRHLAVLKSAGLVTERRDANRVLYSLVSDRLALCLSSFLSSVRPDRVPSRHQGKKRPKASRASAKASTANKASTKDERRRAAAKLAQPVATVPPAALSANA
jgi:DNA-binding transcriptional ArsR family regulator